jgi:8-oxo-dGTP diphosphatase
MPGWRAEIASTTVGQLLYTAANEVNSMQKIDAYRLAEQPETWMTQQGKSSREYPDRPLVGVGGVVIEDGRALLIRRGTQPLLGEWSIPGGTLELGETLEQGVARELLEETGLEVRVIELIEVFDRIYLETAAGEPVEKKGPRFHYVIVDYLCERLGGTAIAGSDVTDVAYAREEELGNFGLTETATRILKKAFAMARKRSDN